MRILMFSHGYVPTVSGVTLVVQKIARAMVRRGHQVTVVTASERGKPYQSEDEGVRLVRTWSIPNPGWSEGPIPFISPSSIRTLADQFQPDVIHTHENAVLSNLLLRVKWGKPQVMVSSCYSLPSYLTQYLPFRWMESGTEALLWKTMVANLNRFDYVVFCTHTHERDFLAHGLRPPTTVISNGVDLQRYHLEKAPGEDIERRYALPPAPRILSVGRLAKDKKLSVLIQAMAQVCARREAHLLMVGRGDDLAHLERVIHRLKVEPFIHLLGFVPEQDLPALYRACDLFAIPSLVEVQSLPTLQAAVTGLPIVATNSAALPELVRNGENGFLVEPLNAAAMGDAILSILDHPDEARRMGQVSLAIGREHDEQTTFQAYEDFYKCMAGVGR